MRILDKFKADKYLFIIVAIILILGFIVRLNDYSEVAYWGDDFSTIPSGLLWFYPHKYFPGLSGNSEPPLGNMIIGLSCILSGEDFSKVSEILPEFYPGREILIGEPLVKAENYCHFPMYLFGILFFIAIIILAFMIIDKKSAIFASSFFAFFPLLLKFSRWIHVDIILYFLVAVGLIFLWKGYNEVKESKKETSFFVLSGIFFGLSLATKQSAGIFFIFMIFIILEKYKVGGKQIFRLITKKIDEDQLNKRPFIKNLLYSIVAFILFLLIPLKLNPKNLVDVVTKYKKSNPETASLGFNKEFLSGIYDLLLKINILDLLIFIFSFYIAYKIIKKKEKSNNEKFLLYLIFLFLITMLISQAMNIDRVSFPYFFGWILLMSLIFSNKEYSLFEKLKINNKKGIFIIFMIVYITYSFVIAYNSSPIFSTTNSILCLFNKQACASEISAISYSAKETASLLNQIMNDNETFIPIQPVTLTFYTRRADGIYNFQFLEAFQRQIGRDPRIEDYLSYYHPEDRNVRYLLLDSYQSPNEKDFKYIYENFNPNYVVKVKNKEALFIYDLYSLKKR